MSTHDGINGTDEPDDAPVSIDLTADLRAMALELDRAISQGVDALDDARTILPAMMHLQGLLSIALAVDKLANVIQVAVTANADICTLADIPADDMGHA